MQHWRYIITVNADKYSLRLFFSSEIYMFCNFCFTFFSQSRYTNIMVVIIFNIMPHDNLSLNCLKYNQLFHQITSCQNTFCRSLHHTLFGTRALLFFSTLLQALSKALTEDELIYLRAQFKLLQPKDGCVSLDNFKMVGSTPTFLFIFPF